MLNVHHVINEMVAGQAQVIKYDVAGVMNRQHGSEVDKAKLIATAVAHEKMFEQGAGRFRPEQGDRSPVFTLLGGDDPDGV